ncbi:pyrimidine 5'-nucleotidase [Marinomonas sp. 2405UD68-3]|uniref:pyrimidine 5'-nucleotidase n=1 Tax=Marinomonas sp. 2405UD68-3 TaxID=3391835 RepID=UPI0039C9B56A
MQYDWIMFDADETLFHFNAFEGLRTAFIEFDVDFSAADYDEYQALNKPLWVQYQNDEIDAETLKNRRFSEWAKRLNVSEMTLNAAFLKAMTQVCTPLDGVLDLLNALQGQAKLAIITNGFTDLQQSRLERNGLQHTFEFLAISEQVGVAKPNKGIFEFAFEKMGHPAKDKILMVGDTLTSDVLGGLNAGIDTCWYNPHSLSNTENFSATFEVSSHDELKRFLIQA